MTMAQKNYLAFYYNDVEMGGGMHDCIGAFTTKEQAIKTIENKHQQEWPDDLHWRYGNGHVYGIREGQLVHHHMKTIIVPQQLELFESDNQ